MGNSTGTDDQVRVPPTWDPGLVGLYRERYLAYVRLAYLLTGRRMVAEELTQEAFVATHRAWARVESPGAYVRAAVVNRCRSWMRRQRVERVHEPPPPEPAELEADELWDALGRLDHRRRTAIVLRFYEDLPDDEIAEVLGCRPATVRTLVHRALKDLRKEISR
ncbi:MAG: sigma-70 family RNA polymerase sigma factor [Actinomycetota bacterium]|nr:sigma-70 family RNA polymerase sigma factor [Actinomycetota bacterium]